MDIIKSQTDVKWKESQSHLLLSPAEVVVVHEPEDELEDGQRLVVVALLRLGQERRLDRLALHLPQVRLEVDVGPLESWVTLG